MNILANTVPTNPAADNCLQAQGHRSTVDNPTEVTMRHTRHALGNASIDLVENLFSAWPSEMTGPDHPIAWVIE